MAHCIRLNASTARYVMVVGREILCNGELQAAAVLHPEEELNNTLAKRLLTHNECSLVVLHADGILIRMHGYGMMSECMLRKMNTDQTEARQGSIQTSEKDVSVVSRSMIVKVLCCTEHI